MYYSSTNTANFGDSSNTLQVNKIARPATSITAPALAGKYFVSSVDKTGNESTTAATTTILSSELPQLGQSDTHTESTGFSGSKTNLTVSSGNLFMTDSSSAGATGTYEFDHNGVGYFDVGTNRTIRLSSAVTFTRKHANASGGQVNWDDIPNNWDTWPNNWDDWTYETTNFNDFAVLIEARAATTTGGLPSASYVTASGEITGRYVQFRAILSNTNAKRNPEHNGTKCHSGVLVMSQHDFSIANQTASNARADINSALQALATNNSGNSAPSTTYANMWWYENDTNLLKIRNESDNGWISVAYLDGTNWEILDNTQVVNTSGTQVGVLGDQATSTWQTGTGTTESLVSPAKVSSAVASKLNVTGSAPIYGVRAWVNFVGNGSSSANATLKRFWKYFHCLQSRYR